MHNADPELLSRLLGEHGPALVLYAQQFCDSPEDVVQDAFIQLVRQCPRPENPVGWLYRVVRNGAVSASRAAARRTRHETCIASRCNIWFEPSTDDVLDSKTVIAALDSLRPELREVIVLRIWGQQSFDQIAAVIDKSISTAHRRYETAIETLQQRLCAKPEGAMQ